MAATKGARGAEAVVALDGLADARLGEADDHDEGAQVHEQVGHQVKEDGLLGVASEDAQGHQQVAGVGDGGVGQQALDVALQDGREVAQGHGGRGDDTQQHHPGDAQQLGVVGHAHRPGAGEEAEQQARSPPPWGPPRGRR